MYLLPVLDASNQPQQQEPILQIPSTSIRTIITANPISPRADATPMTSAQGLPAPTDEAAQITAIIATAISLTIMFLFGCFFLGRCHVRRRRSLQLALSRDNPHTNHALGHHAPGPAGRVLWPWPPTVSVGSASNARNAEIGAESFDSGEETESVTTYSSERQEGDRLSLEDLPKYEPPQHPPVSTTPISLTPSSSSITLRPDGVEMASVPQIVTPAQSLTLQQFLFEQGAGSPRPVTDCADCPPPLPNRQGIQPLAPSLPSRLAITTTSTNHAPPSPMSVSSISLPTQSSCPPTPSNPPILSVETSSSGPPPAYVP
ncbi:hypothetical protein DFS34DRAFT_644588 [Phlyctochytrium arcticum]|nr:hypothetical protein DFS34DRAFT_644588 [Phlyctochytrium arcticum]